MEYPENRDTLVISDRWRSELTMPHDENNEHACTACGICMMNCPNGTISVTSSTVETEDGKKKRVLDAYTWNQGVAPLQPLRAHLPLEGHRLYQRFRGAVFNKEKLIYRLNQPGSKLREKKKTQ